MEKLCLLPQNFLRSPVRMYGWMYVINFCVDGEVFSISYNILWKSKGNKITRWRMLYYQAWWKCRRRWWLMVCLIIGNGCVSYSYKHAFLRGFDRLPYLILYWPLPQCGRRVFQFWNQIHSTFTSTTKMVQITDYRVKLEDCYFFLFTYLTSFSLLTQLNKLRTPDSTPYCCWFG